MSHYRKMRTNLRRDYAVRHSSFRWTWLLLGMFLGILVTAALVILSKRWPFPVTSLTTQHPAIPSQPEKTIHTAALNTPPAKKNPAQRFEFYQLLPGMEVTIPEETSKVIPKNTENVALSPKTAEKPNPAPTPKSPPAKTLSKPALTKTQRPPVSVQRRMAAAQYLIQVGTYRDTENAQALKKRLVSQQFSPHIQKVETETGTWFRVTVGPFSTEAMALQQKRRLEKQNIRGILILQR